MPRQPSIAAFAKARITKPGAAPTSKLSSNNANVNRAPELKKSAADPATTKTKISKVNPIKATTNGGGSDIVTPDKMKATPQKHQKPDPRRSSAPAHGNSSLRGSTPGRTLPKPKPKPKPTNQSADRPFIKGNANEVIEVPSDSEVEDFGTAKKPKPARQTDGTVIKTERPSATTKQSRQHTSPKTPVETPRKRRAKSMPSQDKVPLSDQDSDCVVESVRKILPKPGSRTKSRLPRRSRGERAKSAQPPAGKSNVKDHVPPQNKKGYIQTTQFIDDSDVEMLDAKSVVDDASTPIKKTTTPTPKQSAPRSARSVKLEPKSPTPLHRFEKDAMMIDLTQVSSDDSDVDSVADEFIIEKIYPNVQTPTPKKALGAAINTSTPASSARRCRERLELAQKEASRSQIAALVKAKKPTKAVFGPSNGEGDAKNLASMASNIRGEDTALKTSRVPSLVGGKKTFAASRDTGSTPIDKTSGSNSKLVAVVAKTPEIPPRHSNRFSSVDTLRASVGSACESVKSPLQLEKQCEATEKQSADVVVDDNNHNDQISTATGMQGLKRT